MTEPVTIYVALMNEDVEVWRPVRATPMGKHRYRLPNDAPEGETWEFAPGATVVAEERPLSEGPALVAVGRAE